MGCVVYSFDEVEELPEENKNPYVCTYTYLYLKISNKYLLKLSRDQDDRKK